MFWNKKGKNEKVEAPKKTISGQFSDINNLYLASQIVVHKIATDESKSLDERIKFLRDAVMNKEPELVEGEILDELRTNLTRTEVSYTHLQEKETDTQKKLELATDLRDYAEALFHLKMAWCIMETDLSNEGAEKYGERTGEHRSKKEEVEGKFNRLLKTQ